MARCATSCLSSHILSTELANDEMIGRMYHGLIEGNLEKTSLLTRIGCGEEGGRREGSVEPNDK